MKPMTNHNVVTTVQKLGDKWSKILRVQDYDVSIKLVPQANLESNSCLGQCWVSETKKIAEIKLLDPRYRGDCSESRDDDIETCLVHEYLHLVLPVHALGIPWDEKDPRHCAYEQGIDILAQALVGVSRNGQSKRAGKRRRIHRTHALRRRND
jgi:hypothetical protein